MSIETFGRIILLRYVQADCTIFSSFSKHDVVQNMPSKLIENTSYLFRHPEPYHCLQTPLRVVP